MSAFEPLRPADQYRTSRNGVFWSEWRDLLPKADAEYPWEPFIQVRIWHGGKWLESEACDWPLDT